MPVPRLNSPAAQEALAAFLARPDRRTVEPLLLACREFVLVQAAAWRQAGMALQDRCREILSEMFLLLMEEVDGGRLPRPDSLLAYLALRLRRLTRPKRERALAFGLEPDLPEVGRCELTPFRRDLVREIVGAVRRALLSEAREDTKALEFLFIHVRPELAWASRQLARRDGKEPETRQEADKKRHQAFHRGVRDRFDDLRSGDWREVAGWSAGERSHLAWSIIDLAAEEARHLGESHYQALESWRDAATPATDDPGLVADLVPRCLQAMSAAHPPLASGSPLESVAGRPLASGSPLESVAGRPLAGPPGTTPRHEARTRAPSMVSEEAAPYGSPAEPPDLFALLFPPVSREFRPAALGDSAIPHPEDTALEVSPEAGAEAFAAACSAVLAWTERWFVPVPTAATHADSGGAPRPPRGDRTPANHPPRAPRGGRRRT
ncbi:MAG: hypothetical protein GX442_22620 [Candidatus Riflebacteria bacterium]|nr:hypothetical protein [Candidatus Riflebacteria bacterium]